uniref:Putative toll-Interleukin receptor n=1 Tax=Candidatus Nitrotoga fabula TaxID=2182327 RepID=A0A2X0SIT8_9PROT|nr:putative toll-Interleukin receptor [Candidatus Nitrotoga fabula]
MKIFISWSGTRSQKVANLISDWLCCVIQAAKPWISTRDLDRGSFWFGEINNQLKDTSVGIICLTQENKNRPWILFEAGALAKGLSTSRVCTFLIDLEPRDIEDPLAQFNHTFPNQESVLALVRTLNDALGTSGLDIRILEQVFYTYWPQFENGFKNALANTEPISPTKPRPKEDVLGEILDSTRMLNARIRRLESNFELSKSDQTRYKNRFFDGSPLEEHPDINKIKKLMVFGVPIEVLFERFPEIPRDLIHAIYQDYNEFFRANAKDN